MEPTGFTELAWLLVAQSSAVLSRTQLGNTCRGWYWHVHRLEHGRFWQIVMADFCHVSQILEAERALDRWSKTTPPADSTGRTTARDSNIQASFIPQMEFGGSRDNKLRWQNRPSGAWAVRPPLSSPNFRLDFLAILSSTPSDHAFRPRLPTTPSGHAF